MRLQHVFCLLAIAAVTQASGQSGSFRKGQMDICPGIGLVSTLDAPLVRAGFTTETLTPPISLSVEGGISDAFSLGGYLGYAKTDLTYPLLGWEATVSHLIIGIRGLYHFNISDKFDTYGGAMIGYNAATIKGDDEDKVDLKLYTYSLLLGARYRFAKNVGVFLDLGYGVTVVNIGLNFRSPGKESQKKKHK